MARETKFIDEKMNQVLLKEFLKEKTSRAGFGGCDISRTPMGTRITLKIQRPALVIGRKGRSIRALTNKVKDKFDFDNPQIEVQEVKVPELNPQIMAGKLANDLERGWHFRRAGHSMVREIMRAGARGVQIILSGKITGPRHRVEKFVEGHIKHCGEEEKKWMHEGFETAKVKLGVIGVTVQIMDPNAKLPDEIEIIAPKPKEQKKEEKVEEKKEEAEEEEEEVEEPEPEEEKEEPEPEEEVEEPEPEEEEPEEEVEEPEPEEEEPEPEEVEEPEEEEVEEPEEEEVEEPEEEEVEEPEEEEVEEPEEVEVEEPEEVEVEEPEEEEEVEEDASA